MGGELQHRIDLLATYARKPLDEVINGGTVLEILKQRFHRNPGPAKDKSTAYRFWRSGDFGAIGPIEHHHYFIPATGHRQPCLPSAVYLVPFGPLTRYKPTATRHRGASRRTRVSSVHQFRLERLFPGKSAHSEDESAATAA